jgi:hypothetical protein
MAPEYDFMKLTNDELLNYYKNNAFKKNKSMTNNDIFKKLRVSVIAVMIK